MLSILTKDEVLRKGLAYVGVDHAIQCKWSESKLEEYFHKHYGSSSLVVATTWNELCVTAIRGAELVKREKSEKGFIRYLAAHFFLWTYPKNIVIMVTQFRLLICERYLEGKELWRWPKKIAVLKSLKIVWRDRLNDGSTAHLALSVDGVNQASFEKKHPRYNKNQPYYDHKSNGCGFKHEIALEVYHDQIAWIKGPFRAGKHDNVVFGEDGLKEKLRSTPGKMGIADGGYAHGASGEGMHYLGVPSTLDSSELANFKTRARCRHETLNGRLKNFKILQDMFRHGEECNGIAFAAVAVIVQYQMENGAPLFEL